MGSGVFADRFMRGHLFEVRVYSGLTQAEIASVESEMYSYWSNPPSTPVILPCGPTPSNSFTPSISISPSVSAPVSESPTPTPPEKTTTPSSVCSDGEIEGCAKEVLGGEAPKPLEGSPVDSKVRIEEWTPVVNHDSDAIATIGPQVQLPVLFRLLQ